MFPDSCVFFFLDLFLCFAAAHPLPPSTFSHSLHLSSTKSCVRHGSHNTCDAFTLLSVVLPGWPHPAFCLLSMLCRSPRASQVAKAYSACQELCSTLGSPRLWQWGSCSQGSCERLVTPGFLLAAVLPPSGPFEKVGGGLLWVTAVMGGRGGYTRKTQCLVCPAQLQAIPPDSCVWKSVVIVLIQTLTTLGTFYIVIAYATVGKQLSSTSVGLWTKMFFQIACVYKKMNMCFVW